jgi:hypothetical protein
MSSFIRFILENNINFLVAVFSCISTPYNMTVLIVSKKSKIYRIEFGLFAHKFR